MKFLFILVALFVSITTISTENMSIKKVEAIEKSISFLTKKINEIRQSLSNRIQDYSLRIQKAFHRPNATINRNVCLWKICSRPLRSSVKSGQQNLLQFKQKIIKKLLKDKTKLVFLVKYF